MSRAMQSSGCDGGCEGRDDGRGASYGERSVGGTMGRVGGQERAALVVVSGSDEPETVRTLDATGRPSPCHLHQQPATTANSAF